MAKHTKIFWHLESGSVHNCIFLLLLAIFCSFMIDIAKVWLIRELLV